MKFIDTMLGFAVLTGPLWLILILLPVFIWIAVKIAKRFKPGITRIAGGIGIFLLFFALPFGDEIAGRIYLSHLCATEAGVKVYHTVELPSEFWDEKGRAKFIKGRGALDTSVLSDYETKSEIQMISSFYHISRFKFSYIENKGKKVLGTVTDYRFSGGWVTRLFSPSGQSGSSCDLAELNDPKAILLSIFKSAVN